MAYIAMTKDHDQWTWPMTMTGGYLIVILIKVPLKYVTSTPFVQGNQKDFQVRKMITWYQNCRNIIFFFRNPASVYLGFSFIYCLRLFHNNFLHLHLTSVEELNQEIIMLCLAIICIYFTNTSGQLNRQMYIYLT